MAQLQAHPARASGRLRALRPRAVYHGARVTRPVRRWWFLRLSMRIHATMHRLRTSTGRSMAELVETAVEFTFNPKRRRRMEAMRFYVLFLDEKPAVIVAARDAATAEQGYRQNFLGSGQTVKATDLMDTPGDVVARIGTAAILTQLTQVNALIQMLAQRNGLITFPGQKPS